MSNPITVADLQNALKKCKGTTPGLDKITYPMIKNSSITFKLRLCKLYTTILIEGIYPHAWKHAILSPIPKPGKNPNSTEGYRPISLLPVLSKVLDRILAQRLWKHCKTNIANEQHAYLPNRGVFTLCHQIETQIKKNMREKKHSTILSEDLEKAFDKVVHFAIITI